MADEVLERTIRETLAAQATPEVHFAWQGGEPTLAGLDFFRKAVALQQQHGGGRLVRNALQTNGVLLDDEWGRFLAENRFLVGLSIDGPPDVHDRWRVDRGGAPSHAKVVKGLEVLHRHGVEFNTLTVVHRESACRPLEVYGYLKEIGSRVMQFLPLVDRGRPWCIEPQDWGEFLCSIFDEWKVHDQGRVFVQLFEVALESWLGLPQSLCFFRPTCGSAVAVEHNGDLYSCDHFVDAENRLGNLMQQTAAWMVNSPQQKQFGRNKQELLAAKCLSCDVRFACHGECPKNRDKKGLNYLCEGYYRFFQHVDPWMRNAVRHLRPSAGARSPVASDPGAAWPAPPAAAPG